MTIKVLDGYRFAEMIRQGANHLSTNAKAVDALNVFPVPDGDTGTNMNLSMTSGAKEVKNNTQAHIGKVGQALSKGLLMGARGNSGVILSQLFRGFSKAIEQKETITAQDFSHALEAGVETAYKAVMKPVEGTILTVAKDAAKKAAETAKTESDLIKVMEAVVKEAKASLNRTPDLLPVLKEVGVVDSGGQGLVYVYEGFLAELKGENLSETPIEPSMNELVELEHHKSVQGHISTEEIEFGYCTEFMVRFEEDKVKKNPFNEEQFRLDLSRHGDSLLVIADDEIVKVHVHAEHPGEVLSYAQTFGSLINIKIENMREQHSNIIGNQTAAPAKPAAKKENIDFGIVTVAMGTGIADLFRSIGAHSVIEGGQTMNPSTEDIVKAIKEVNAKQVIILPNNKNIVLAAEQAAAVVEIPVEVVKTKTVPQGLSALLAFNPTVSLEENKRNMEEATEHVKTGQVTHSVRDTVIDGLELKTGDFMGIADGSIKVKSAEKQDAAIQLLKEMLDEDSEILTILVGEDATEQEVDDIIQFVEENFADVEIEVHQGNQPLYPFIFSIE